MLGCQCHYVLKWSLQRDDQVQICCLSGKEEADEGDIKTVENGPDSSSYLPNPPRTRS